MKPSTRSLLFRAFLLLSLFVYSFFIGLLLTGVSTTYAASSITVTECHEPINSSLLASYENKDNAQHDIVVQLWYCPAYQSVYGRFIYVSGPNNHATGTCGLVKDHNGNPEYGREGCISGLSIGSSVDTQLTYGPNEIWAACWFSTAFSTTNAPNTICTAETTASPAGAER